MNHIKRPPLISSGDLVILIAPAKYIDVQYIDLVKQFWQQQGYRVEVGQRAQNQWHRFAGNDQMRLADLQWALNHQEAKVIHCLRGGYGVSRIIDQLNWQIFIDQPKWLVGYSDITLLHQKINALGIASLHASMPFDAVNNKLRTDDFLAMVHYLESGALSYHVPWHPLNQSGLINAPIVGGNLTLISMALGTKFQANYHGAILFIEEIDEYDYVIDRYLYQCKHHGLWQQIEGLIIGHLTKIKSSPDGMGASIEALFLEQINTRNIPVMFGFPAGHQAPNLALPFNLQAELNVNFNANRLALK